MRPLILAVALLTAILPAARAQGKIQISAVLNGYDLRQVRGESSLVNELPKVVVPPGTLAVLAITKEHTYPKLFDPRGVPTLINTAYLGIRVPVTVHETGGKLAYFARAELCEIDNPADPLSPIRKTTTSFRGTATSGQPVTISISSPRGGKAKLEMTFSTL